MQQTANHLSDAARELQLSAAALRRARLHLEAGDVAAARVEHLAADGGVQAARALLARVEEGLRQGVPS